MSPACVTTVMFSMLLLLLLLLRGCLATSEPHLSGQDHVTGTVCPGCQWVCGRDETCCQTMTDADGGCCNLPNVRRSFAASL